MARKRDRIFALSIAILFFVTALGSGFFAVYQSVTANNNSNAASDASAQAQTQPSSTLDGTKLANFTPVSAVKSIQVTDTKKGTGAAVTSAKQTVTVDYTGAVAASGVIFDSSEGAQPITSPLNGLIPGWQTGLIGMKVGGTRRILIPANLGYGATPPQGSGIPANAPLVFDVTLEKVQ